MTQSVQEVPIDIPRSAFPWYLTSSSLWMAAMSLQGLAVETGLSKSAVQAGLRTLVRRRLVRVEKASRTAVPAYIVLRPWNRRG